MQTKSFSDGTQDSESLASNLLFVLFILQAKFQVCANLVFDDPQDKLPTKQTIATVMLIEKVLPHLFVFFFSFYSFPP